MPNLEEYKAKQILNDHGINIPRGSVASEYNDLALSSFNNINDFVVKSQVPVASRGKKGGIISTQRASLERSFNAIRAKIIDNIETEKVLVEEKIEYDKQYYICVYSSALERSPELLFSKDGGVDVENNTHIYRLSFNIIMGKPLQPYEVFFRNIGELSNKEIEVFSDIALKLYHIYRTYDCKLVEINPLVCNNGNYIALDAKIIIDEDALFRQKTLSLDFTEEIEGRAPTTLEKMASSIDKNDHRGTAHFVQLPIESMRSLYADKIRCFLGFNCVGTGVSLTVMDELARLGYFVRNFSDTSGNPPASKVYRMTKIILAQTNVEGYVFASCVSSQQLDNTARGLIKAFKEIYAGTAGVPNIPAVILLRGAWEEEAIGLFKEHGLCNTDTFVILDSRFTEHDVAIKFDAAYKQWHGKKSIRV